LLPGEFAVEIIALYQREDRPTCQAARDGDLFETAARTRARAGPDPADDGGPTRAERSELAQLRRENRRLREYVEILKQATAIFATATR